jgi:hypothetical protein
MFPLFSSCFHEGTIFFSYFFSSNLTHFFSLNPLDIIKLSHSATKSLICDLFFHPDKWNLFYSVLFFSFSRFLILHLHHFLSDIMFGLSVCKTQCLTNFWTFLNQRLLIPISLFGVTLIFCSGRVLDAIFLFLSSFSILFFSKSKLQKIESSVDVLWFVLLPGLDLGI